MGKPKRKFNVAVKTAAVDDYVSGRRSAAQVAASLEISVGQLYRWKVQLDERAKEASIEDLTEGGRSFADLARENAELRTERDHYRGVVGEQAVIVELLKKRLQSTSSQRRSELTGLIETLESAARKRKRGGS